MKPFSRKLIILILGALLLCGAAAACRTAEAETPEGPGNIPASDPPPEASEAETVLTPYTPEGPGTKDLIYNDHREYLLQEYETEQPDGGFSTGASLIYRGLDTGNEWVLDDLDYGSDHPYWNSMRLYPFTGILGCDGFIFEHPLGACCEVYDFYRVSDAGTLLIATCYNTMYTADLDGDGQLELLSNYLNAGCLDLFWSDEEHWSARSCSLNETALDYFGLHPVRNWVELYVQEGTGVAAAEWETESGLRQSETVDIAALWEWEKNRTESWEILMMPYTAGDHAPLLLLRETRDPSFRNDLYQVDEIQVYEDGTLVQTISAASLSYDGEYLFTGLYALRKNYLGAPVVQDLNFDGSADLGLLAVNFFPHNVSFCYFLWDEEAGQLSTDFFVLSGPLEVDEENRQIVESVCNGNAGSTTNYYHFDSSAQPVLIRQEVYTTWEAPDWKYWHVTYERIDGEMTETSRELCESIS